MRQIKHLLSRLVGRSKAANSVSTPIQSESNYTAILPARLVYARPLDQFPSPQNQAVVINKGGKIGIHSFSRANCIEWLRDLEGREAQFPVVKAVNDVSWLHEVKRVDGRIITIGRIDVDGPLGSSLRGIETVRNGHYDQFVDALFEPIIVHLAADPALYRSVDYWEICNEPQPTGSDGWRKVAECMIACIARAKQIGIKLALFSTAAGSPEWWEMQAMVETGVFKHARAGGHIMACHETAHGAADNSTEDVWDSSVALWHGHPIPANKTGTRWVQLRDSGLFQFDYDPTEDVQPHFWQDGNAGPLLFRYRFLYELLKQRDEVVPLIISETVYGGDYHDTADTALRIAWYDKRAADDSYLLAHLPFTLGGFGNGWAHQEYSFVWPTVMDYIISVNKRQNAQPSKDEAQFNKSVYHPAVMRESGSNTQRGQLNQIVTIHLLPQVASLDEKIQVLTTTNGRHGDLVQSALIAAKLAQQGLDGSRVVVWEGQRWAGDIDANLSDRGVLLERRSLPEADNSQPIMRPVKAPQPGLINLFPPDVTLAEKRTVAERTHVRNEALVHSAEIAVALYRLGSTGSRIKVWAPERWQDDILHHLRDEDVWIETLDF